MLIPLIVAAAAAVMIACEVARPGRRWPQVAGWWLRTGLAELFYHWNVPTPHWLGYLIQRPESHCVHHQEGLHGYNYGDLPLWDMLFGTFRNPRRWEARCGFGPDKEQQLAQMLAG